MYLLLAVGMLQGLLRGTRRASAPCTHSFTPQAGAVDPAELAMYAALMTSNTNVEMVEYLMAG